MGVLPGASRCVPPVGVMADYSQDFPISSEDEDGIEEEDELDENQQFIMRQLEEKMAETETWRKKVQAHKQAVKQREEEDGADEGLPQGIYDAATESNWQLVRTWLDSGGCPDTHAASHWSRWRPRPKAWRSYSTTGAGTIAAIAAPGLVLRPEEASGSR